jgi:hypothetical protein
MIMFVHLLQQHITDHDCVLHIIVCIVHYQHTDYLMVVVQPSQATVECRIVQDFSLERGCLKERSILFVS